MFKKSLLGCILWLITTQTWSQESAIRHAINYPKLDTTRCFLLNKIIEDESDHTIWFSYNQLLIQSVTQALKKCPPSNPNYRTYQKYQAIAYLNKGAYYHYNDQYNKAIQWYKKSLLCSRRINFHEQSASCLQNIGSAYDYLGKLDSSLVYFKKALIYARISKNKSNIAYVLTDLGFVYNNLGHVKKAIDCNLDALRLFQNLNDDEGIERTYLALGRIFDTQREYSKSILYYAKALEITNKTQNLNRKGILLNSLAASHLALKNYSRSKNFALQALVIAKENKFDAIQAVSLSLIGENEVAQNNHQQALPFLEQAKTIFKQLNQANNHIKTSIQIASIQKKLGQNQKAFILAHEAFEGAKISNYPSQQKESAELLAKMYHDQKNDQKAFFYQSFAKRIGDSLFYDEAKNTALKSEFTFETENREAKIKALSQQQKISTLENQRQKSLLWFLVVGIISIATVVYLLFKRYKSNQQNELLRVKLEETEKRLFAEKKAAESELKALKSQMNPHFIFNALNSIQEQFMFGDKQLANEQMGNFTYLTRQILTISGKKKIPLSTEIEVLTKYLELEKMRFDNDFEYQITLDENIDEEYTELPPMLIQPFVENSVKHGLLHQSGQKTIHVHFALNTEETQLLCTIEDNGIGREQSAKIQNKNKHNSYSTKSIAQRLELLADGNSSQSLMNYYDLKDDQGKPTGTRVILQIYL